MTTVLSTILSLSSTDRLVSLTVGALLRTERAPFFSSVLILLLYFSFEIAFLSCDLLSGCLIFYLLLFFLSLLTSASKIILRYRPKDSFPYSSLYFTLVSR